MFLRHYPFLLAGPAPGQGDALTLCFDASVAELNESEGHALFNQDGSNSEFLDELTRSMNDFRLELTRTRAFAAELERLDLLETRSATIRNAANAVFELRDFLVVSDTRFAVLDADSFAHLHRQGFLGWIYAHLMSLANLPTLLDLHLAGKSARSKPGGDRIVN
jgi:hypothetical protein